MSQNDDEKNLTEVEEKLKDFSDLLDTLTSTKVKKKLLWKDAYQNAIEDRDHAHILVTDLIMKIHGNLTNHQTYGVIMAKYLERMAKSNDQILKLAELVSKEQEANAISSDDIFNEINGE